jgi:golgi apyrase
VCSTPRFYYRADGRREIEGVTSKKVTPGLSAFENDPEAAGRYLRPLFDHAGTVVPPKDQAETVVFIQATAGMRLLPEVRRGG